MVGSLLLRVFSASFDLEDNHRNFGFGRGIFRDSQGRQSLPGWFLFCHQVPEGLLKYPPSIKIAGANA